MLLWFACWNLDRLAVSIESPRGGHLGLESPGAGWIFFSEPPRDFENLDQTLFMPPVDQFVDQGERFVNNVGARHVNDRPSRRNHEYRPRQHESLPTSETWWQAGRNRYFTVELLDKVKSQTNFDLLVPMPDQPSRRKKLQELPPETFRPRWAGYATAKLAYTPRNSQAGPFYQYIQREGERPEEYHFKAFLSTTDRDEVETLTGDFPKRWHVEEFFNAHQALGWDRAGTCNLNIRYGQMTMALIAQAAIDGLRKRLAPPAASWDAEHLAKAYFAGLEGDVRVVRQYHLSNIL